jgi:uncharacterized protein YbbC (DUF1343 family)
VANHIDVKKEGLLFGRVAHGKPGYQQVPAYAVNFFFYGILKAKHDEERNNGRGKPQRNGCYGNVVNEARKTLCRAAADALRKKEREIQKLAYFWLMIAAKKMKMNRFLLMGAWICAAAATPAQPASVVLGVHQLDKVEKLTQGKRVALLVNHTAALGNVHLVDLLRSLKVDVRKVFAPEHGFRGLADAGETIPDGKDPETGIPIASLYGNTKKPTPAQLADVDVVIFDIQDVGARFFTYISTLHYMMEACAENKKKLVVLDRPNPNGHYVDGPLLLPEQKSFVGMHPIPIVHGLTVGELALMINGEGWLGPGKKCELEVIQMLFYDRSKPYLLPVKPSPNLPSPHSILLYPSTCLFEGTALSVGRGTPTPFEVVGHPSLVGAPHQFTPVSIPGMARKPPFENQLCHGWDFRDAKPENRIVLQWLIDAYQAYPEKDKFFIPYFDKLAGTPLLRQQIQSGLSEAQIRETWKSDLEAYQKVRAKYLLYP